jgi:hypothetical protein
LCVSTAQDDRELDALSPFSLIELLNNVMQKVSPWVNILSTRSNPVAIAGL